MTQYTATLLKSSGKKENELNAIELLAREKRLEFEQIKLFYPIENVNKVRGQPETINRRTVLTNPISKLWVSIHEKDHIASEQLAKQGLEANPYEPFLLATIAASLILNKEILSRERNTLIRPSPTTHKTGIIWFGILSYAKCRLSGCFEYVTKDEIRFPVYEDLQLTGYWIALDKFKVPE